MTRSRVNLVLTLVVFPVVLTTCDVITSVSRDGVGVGGVRVIDSQTRTAARPGTFRLVVPQYAQQCKVGQARNGTGLKACI